MEGDAVPFAIEHDRAETEWCDRMFLGEYPTPQLLYLRQGFVKTAVGVQVKQGAAF